MDAGRNLKPFGEEMSKIAFFDGSKTGRPRGGKSDMSENLELDGECWI